MNKCEKAFEVVEDKKYDPIGFMVVGPSRNHVAIYERKSDALWLSTLLNYAYRGGFRASAKKKTVRGR